MIKYISSIGFDLNGVEYHDESELSWRDEMTPMNCAVFGLVQIDTFKMRA